MDNIELKDYLKQKIHDSIAIPQSSEIILTDLPYHGNIGDILIWEGELCFLNQIGIKTIKLSSRQTFGFPDISEDVIICLHGGGNFGDLYRASQEFRLRVIEKYRKNRIIIFPQSIWYNDPTLLTDDIKILSSHPNLTICLRDETSYATLKPYFNNLKILLVPDMAFCIDWITRDVYPKNNNSNTLLIKRLDPEATEDELPDIKQCDVRDWPIFEGRWDSIRIFLAIFSRIYKLRDNSTKRILLKIVDYTMQKYLKKILMGKGIDLLNAYQSIITTRLHGLILGILMDKTIYILDNSTGKLSSFYNTWLTKDDNIIPLYSPKL